MFIRQVAGIDVTQILKLQLPATPIQPYYHPTLLVRPRQKLSITQALKVHSCSSLLPISTGDGPQPLQPALPQEGFTARNSRPCPDASPPLQKVETDCGPWPSGYLTSHTELSPTPL